MKVPFYLHNIGEKEIAQVAEILKTPLLTTGPVTAEFESLFSKYLGVKHAVGLTSCTMAMFVTLKALDIGPGDEVITTPMSFISTANVIIHAGAKPVFVDVEPETGNINVKLIEEAITPATKAILPVHLYGQMVDMKRIKVIADAYNLYIIEDAAHAIESRRDGIRPGQLGNAACFSFYATKNITCGEGGAIATGDEALAGKLKKMRLHGMSKDAVDRYVAKRYQHYDMEFLGYKCNMNNIDAALLINQLNLIEERWERRQEICRNYEKAFSKIEGIDYPKVLENSRSGRHLFTVWVEPDSRDKIMWKLQEKEIGVAVNFRPIHLMKYYREAFGYQPGMFPEAERIGGSTITLPLYPKLSDEEVDYIINTIRDAILRK